MVQGWGKIRLGILVLLISGQLSACSSAIYYQVRRGDTLSEIAQHHGVSVQQIARFNAIRDPDRLETGQWLRIPPSGKGPTVASPSPEKRVLTSSLPQNSALDRPLPKELEDLSSRSRDRDSLGNTSLFSWPVEGEVTSRFGPRNGSSHDGIDISAPEGAPVLVAADGQVIFSDTLRGYGNVVIVRHANGYITVYAHNRVNLAKEGQTVRRGEHIAEVGQSGRATGANLHFEVRKDNFARDPLRYLPQDRQTVLKEPSP